MITIHSVSVFQIQIAINTGEWGKIINKSKFWVNFDTESIEQVSASIQHGMCLIEMNYSSRKMFIVKI